MGNVRRIYVEKKQEYAGRAEQILKEIRDYFRLTGVENVRILIRYDVENISEEIFEKACKTVFSEPPVDRLYMERLTIPENTEMFSVEYLPGQFDQRADSALQCVRFLDEKTEPLIKTAETYLITGAVTKEDMDRIKSYVINPVDSRESEPQKPLTLMTDYEEPDDVAILSGFCEMSEKELEKLYPSLGLAMTPADFKHIHNYFLSEKREPTMTEIRVLDTYWSDHCRHTTFSTELKNIEFEDGYYRMPIETAYQSYLDTREELYGKREDRPVCLMDLALLAMKKLKKSGKLEDMEESEEINACSIVVPVEIDKGEGPEEEEWLVFFKNETHNHPTEIEPFGGAATCLGGAIRDPLSGRGYVYQAMRITGAADPTASADETLKGKLPQLKLVREAAHGYSSYGNQVGLATGYVKEIYHPGYVAKRMEIGAVMGAAPRKNVRRETAVPGDIIVLLGGRTGRDGCGGATGSSKAHTEQSIEVCGAEVQKGNAPTERKIQRLFRRQEVSLMIKKCNDFGAGGVSVAIGELADGLRIDLDKVPKKYAGLDGTELAISESQERMAVVIAPEDEARFLEYAKEENLEAVSVATVTKEPRLILSWRGKEIVNLSRAFLDTNGAHQETEVLVEIPSEEENFLEKYALSEVEKALQEKDWKKAWLATVKDFNVCSQKGLVERFDASIGAGSVFMPYGGKRQLTETQVMAAKLPILEGKTDTVTLMSYGFDPYLSSWSPYHGAIYAVLESIAKIVAAGGDYHGIHFTFQEYFRRMSAEASRWSQPFSALLGAYDAQIGFGLAAIGGKDSMSGSFGDLDVPPTLVSFAVDIAKKEELLTPELKKAGDMLIKIMIERDEYDIPVYEKVMEAYDSVNRFIGKGMVASAYAVDAKGAVAALSRMSFGNGLGIELEDDLDERILFGFGIGNLILEIKEEMIEDFVQFSETEDVDYELLGTVIEEPVFRYRGESLLEEEVLDAWRKPLNKVFPEISEENDKTSVEILNFHTDKIYVCKNKVAKPRVFIPVFPGTNCEYDSARAFAEAGAEPVIWVFRNQNAQDITESIEVFKKSIEQAQIMMFPGGFSAGDEPDGSAKFFATAFRNEKIKEAVEDLINNRDGLVLGICNGFQALIKLGLLPYGKIQDQTEDSPTLTYNVIHRHISKMVYTKVCSNLSPWLKNAELGKTYVNPASHGEGRFVASDAWLDRLSEKGQVATVYADPDGRVSMDENYNINGSYRAIEGITSEDGRIFGKMAHVERRGDGVHINIFGEQDLGIFKAGVEYFH